MEFAATAAAAFHFFSLALFFTFLQKANINTLKIPEMKIHDSRWNPFII